MATLSVGVTQAVKSSDSTLPLTMSGTVTRQFVDSQQKTDKTQIPLVSHVITDEDIGALQVIY